MTIQELADCRGIPVVLDDGPRVDKSHEGEGDALQTHDQRDAMSDDSNVRMDRIGIHGVGRDAIDKSEGRAHGKRQLFAHGYLVSIAKENTACPDGFMRWSSCAVTRRDILFAGLRMAISPFGRTSS